MLSYWMAALIVTIALQNSVIRTVQSVNTSTKTAKVPEWPTKVVCTVEENVELASSATEATRQELKFSSASQENVGWLEVHTSTYVNLRQEKRNAAVPFMQGSESNFQKVDYPGFLCLFTIDVKTGEERIIKLEHYGDLLANTTLIVNTDTTLTYKKLDESTTKAGVESFLTDCKEKFTTIESAWETAQKVINTKILQDLEVDKLAESHNALAVARYLFEDRTSGTSKYFVFVALTLTLPE